MKRLLVIATIFCLVFTYNLTAKAEYKKIFAEYYKEDKYDNYGPKLGFDWGFNDHWGLFASHQFAGEGTNYAISYAEVRYMLTGDLTFLVGYETIKTENSTIFRFNYNPALNDTSWFNGAVTYIATSPRTGSNYHELELYGGFTHLITESLGANLGCNFSNTDYQKNSSLNFQEIEFSAGLDYQLTEAWRLTGRGVLTNINYQDAAMDRLWGKYSKRFVVGASYGYGPYSAYLEYPVPQKGHTSKIGISYSF